MMPRTDLRALVSALDTGNVRKIHEVLNHPLPDTSQVASVESSYSSRLLAVHFLRRFADAIEHRWWIDREELDVLLEFLGDYQPDLKPTTAQTIAQLAPLDGRD